MKNTFWRLLYLSLILLPAWPATAQVKVWEGSLTLPTYKEGQPDPNPPFDAYTTERFNYPYALRDNIANVREPQAWRAIFMENEYLKCTVLPDIGGHIYTCVDKINGQPIFYANPSIKKAKISYRGAWAAFGVEFNFPVSHNWVSMSPVDFAYRAHPDGSASIWIANIDRPYGMQWRVELILRPGSTLLEERVTLYNRSDVRHRYYWWDNAGVQVWDDSRIDYPMRYIATHGFTDMYTWPVGPTDKDLSIIANQTAGPVSYFVHGSREPFMGIWNPHTDAGIAHYSEYRDLPAKKIWAWGVDPDGLRWRKVLSDNNSAYVEVQAGLFRNQETYAFLDPGKSISFNEFWMPVRGIGGISRANKAGVVHFSKQESQLRIGLNVNERIDHARIVLSRDGKVLSTESADLTPEKDWNKTVAAGKGDGSVTFELEDRACAILLKHTDGKYDWDPDSSIVAGPQHIRAIPEPGKRNEDDWLQAGTEEELNGKLLAALATYKAGLLKYPQCQSLAISAGRLATSLLRYDEALPLLKGALAQDTSNSDIAYYLGLAQAAHGQMREAEASLQIVYRQATFRSPAAVRLGEIRARMNDSAGAILYLREARKADPDNQIAAEELEAVLRASGNRSDADELARATLAIDPTSDFLKVESGIPDQDHLAADSFRILRIAAQYMRLGLYPQALAVLDRDYPVLRPDQSEPGSVPPQKNPLLRYYSAFCNQKMGRPGESIRKLALQMDPAYVFPSTAEDLEVLRAAVEANAADANAHYLLGTLLFAKGEADAGIAHWQETKRLAPQMKIVAVDLGDAFLRLKSDPSQALVYFRQALQTDPENGEVYLGLDAAMSVVGLSADERAKTLALYPGADTPDSSMPANLIYQLALTRAEANHFEQALTPFNGRFFPSEEGGVSSAQVQFEIQLLEGGSMAGKHECASARDFLAARMREFPAVGESARTDVLLARLGSACGIGEETRALLGKAAASTRPEDLPWVLEAERALRTYDQVRVRQRLASAIEAMRSHLTRSSHTGTVTLELGELQASAGQLEEAKESLRAVLLLPDENMSHHFARMSLKELAAAK
jgi:tetratricopeptide (TPR) repeat protein